VNDTLRSIVDEEFGIKTYRKSSNPIFLNRYGTGTISTEYVNRALKKAFKEYGYEADQVSTHMFRKSFAYKILEQNNFSDKAIFLVSRMLNHSNINITMKYLLLDQKEAKENYELLTL
jgi:integrase